MYPRMSCARDVGFLRGFVLARQDIHAVDTRYIPSQHLLELTSDTYIWKQLSDSFSQISASRPPTNSCLAGY